MIPKNILNIRVIGTWKSSTLIQVLLQHGQLWYCMRRDNLPHKKPVIRGV